MKCRQCTYFHPEWMADNSQYSYCEFWHEDKRGNDTCEQFEFKNDIQP